MNKISKISVITPCFNAEKYIYETIESVLNQNAVQLKRVELEYIICDGKSTDKTLDMIQSFKSESIRVISEKDNGMYDALSKGLSIANGDVCAYINAGDYYSKYAFDVVIDLMEGKAIHWLTGINTFYNDASQVTSFKLPFRYRRNFIRYGFYGSILPHIQQEVTFWRAELNHLINLEKLSGFKLAGDYFLWLSFSRKYSLYIVESYLGGFKIHSGQLSDNSRLYIQEKEKIVGKNFFLIPLALLDYLIWLLPARIKKILNPKMFLRFKHDNQRWE